MLVYYAHCFRVVWDLTHDLSFVKLFIFCKTWGCWCYGGVLCTLFSRRWDLAPDLTQPFAEYIVDTSVSHTTVPVLVFKLRSTWVNKLIYSIICLHELNRDQTIFPDNKVHGANMGPTGVLSAPDGPHVVPRNLALRGSSKRWIISLRCESIWKYTWIMLLQLYDIYLRR